MKEKLDKKRLYHNFYLVEWDGPSLFIDACDFCELSDECDKLADDLNNIEYCICLHGIYDKEYKVKHPKAYFKKIN